MKKLLFSVFFFLLSATAVQAVPANPMPVKVTQPDGTMVTLRLHGDEYLSFTTTLDGYSVVQDRQGYYVYAQKLADGRLGTTSMIAHDADMRAERELRFLSATPKMLAPVMSQRDAEEQQAEKARRASALQAKVAKAYDYSKFHGLIILVEFNDCQFVYDDMADIMEGMVNQENYRGTSRTNSSSWGTRCTGSVRDFYRDNSDGVFQPVFDIVGPVKVNRSMYYANKTENAPVLIYDVLKAVDDQVDFSRYDTDDDGVVDMIYFLFAGPGSNNAGNDQRLIWPHASQIYNPYGSWWDYTLKMDGVSFGRYACGVELLGEASYNLLDGIGTICHEFSHVLGLPDFYDADYGESGGESIHPGSWSVMSGGNYNNYSRTPAGYSLYERTFLGFTEPEVINAEGTYTLEALNTSHKGYRINSPVTNEYFLFENRQNTKWDASLPGHGMLVFRVDRTNQYIWNSNAVNNNPSHLYYELLFADGYKGLNYSGQIGSASDPFPGTAHVTTLNSSTSPAALSTWSGRACLWGLENIKEQGGKISFDVVDMNVLRSVELPATFLVGVGLSRTLTPTRFPETAPYKFKWQSDNPAVAVVDQDGKVIGISEGTANITVTANETITATCNVVVQELQKAADLAAIRSMSVNEEALLTLTDAQVLYAYGNNAYVRDASGCMVFSGLGLKLSQGNTINGSIYVKRGETNLMPLVQSVGELTDDASLTITSGSKPEALNKRLPELTSADFANYFVVRGVGLRKETLASGSSRVVAFDGDATTLVSNPFALKVSMPSNYEGKLYDIEGIYGTEVVKGQVYNTIYMLGSAITETDITAIATPSMEGSIAASAGVLSLSGFKAGTEVTVFTATGRLVTTARTNANGSLQLPTTAWPSGVLVLHADSENVKLLKK